MALSLERLRRIRDYLRHHTQAEVALLCGVSRATVSAVATGQRKIPRRRRSADVELQEPIPSTRCPTCGRKVVQPCLACSLQPARIGELLDEIGGPLGLDLRGEHLRRYREVRRRAKREIGRPNHYHGVRVARRTERES